jgi:hypothetical protein
VRRAARASAAPSSALRGLVALSLGVVVPLGFASRLCAGPAWATNAVGGALYEVFWCLCAQLLAPRADPRNIALAVFGGTCVLELLQLWHPPFLEEVRQTFLGRTLLGAAFDPWDFAAYAAGSALGWGWLRRLARHATSG